MDNNHVCGPECSFYGTGETTWHLASTATPRPEPQRPLTGDGPITYPPTWESQGPHCTYPPFHAAQPEAEPHPTLPLCATEGQTDGAVEACVVPEATGGGKVARGETSKELSPYAGAEPGGWTLGPETAAVHPLEPYPPAWETLTHCTYPPALTDAELAGIEVRSHNLSLLPSHAAWKSRTDIHQLLAEVARLRAELADERKPQLHSDIDYGYRERSACDGEMSVIEKRCDKCGEYV